MMLFLAFGIVFISSAISMFINNMIVVWELLVMLAMGMLFLRVYEHFRR